MPFHGRPLLHHAVATFSAIEDIREIILVTGHQTAEIQSSVCDFDVRVVHAQRHAEGMSASLRCGVEALSASCDAFFVALGDMPHVAPETISHLIQTMIQHHAVAVAPAYQGCRGHPVLFSRALVPQLLTLTGDKGARAILQHIDIMLIDVDDPGILKDYDTPESFGEDYSDGSIS